MYEGLKFNSKCEASASSEVKLKGCVPLPTPRQARVGEMENLPYPCDVSPRFAPCWKGHGRKCVPASCHSQRKANTWAALAPVKDIPKRGRAQDRKVGISSCFPVHGLCKSLIWLCAAWVNKSCSSYRHLQSILCKKLGSKHRNGSSRARDLLQGGNETKLTLCGTEYCPTP